MCHTWCHTCKQQVAPPQGPAKLLLSSDGGKEGAAWSSLPKLTPPAQAGASCRRLPRSWAPMSGGSPKHRSLFSRHPKAQASAGSTPPGRARSPETEHGAAAPGGQHPRPAGGSPRVACSRGSGQPSAEAPIVFWGVQLPDPKPSHHPASVAWSPSRGWGQRFKSDMATETRKRQASEDPKRKLKRIRAPLRFAVETVNVDDFVLHFWYQRLKQSGQGPWAAPPGGEPGRVAPTLTPQQLDDQIRAELLPWVPRVPRQPPTSRMPAARRAPTSPAQSPFGDARAAAAAHHRQHSSSSAYSPPANIDALALNRGEAPSAEALALAAEDWAHAVRLREGAAVSATSAPPSITPSFTPSLSHAGL